MRRILLPVISLALAFSAASSMAQPATPAQRAGVKTTKPAGTLHLEAPLGSFRFIDCEGRLEVTFRGSLLISQLEGTVTHTPGIKKEVTRDKRQVFFGQGTMVVTGKSRAIQWFGTGMKAVFFGHGLVRVTGEFDRSLNPGRYWFEDPSEAKKRYWFPNSAMTITVPEQIFGKSQSAPRRRSR